MVHSTDISARKGAERHASRDSPCDPSPRRRASREERGEHPRAGPPSTSGLFARVDERSLRVRYALHRLPDLTDRSILVLRFFVGLSLDQISERLLLPVEAVRERYGVALRFMERELGGWL